MFERYTEKARRTIFFARYEAAQLRSPYIETEHLLLGLFREAGGMLRQLTGTNAEQNIREKISARSYSVGKSGTVDLPLSNESKRVLAYAAEDAERLQQRHIGPEHLFLGLLRERNTFAAQLLNEHGVTLERVRSFIASNPATYFPDTVVMIHGQGWSKNYVLGLAKELRRFAWVEQQWQPRDLLIEKGTGRIMFYNGQPYDSERFDFVKGTWPRDHCAICRWELNSTAGADHQTGCTNGQEWLCTECYSRFVAPDAKDYDDFDRNPAQS